MQRSLRRKNLLTGKWEKVLATDPTCVVTRGSINARIGMRQNIRNKSRLAARIPQILKQSTSRFHRQCGHFKSRVVATIGSLPNLP